MTNQIFSSLAYAPAPQAYAPAPQAYGLYFCRFKQICMFILNSQMLIYSLLF